MIFFENFFALIMVLVCFVIGAAIIYIGVYNFIILPRIPKSKHWSKTSVRVVGKSNYVVKSRRGKYDFRSGFDYQRKSEKLIEYTVDGKVYRKSVPDDAKGAARIYYRNSNPHYFKTIQEIKQSKREKGGAVMLVICFIMGAGFVTAGVLCLHELIEKIFG